jgi:FAD/FMN-containing dehydrogenase
MYSPDIVPRFKNGLIEAIKPDNIVEDDVVLDSYAGDISMVTGKRPLLLVYPENREEVQRLVRLAGETGTPLVPVSSGPPRFHGDTLPNQDSVIVDFSKMNRVIKIDPVNRCVLVEPGVTYGELVPLLKEHGLKLITPLLPRTSKSVVTSLLEREPGLVPKYQFDYMDPLLTLEVVYGTGDDFRTGSASGPGGPDVLKADKVNPWGPGTIDYFRFVASAQGTMGLVTWAATKVEIYPKLQKLYFIPLDDLKKLAAPMQMLLSRRVVDECLALNRTNLAAILAENRPGDFDELKANLPPWTIIVCIAGYERRPEERLSIMEKYLVEICTGLGLKLQTVLPGAGGKESKVLELLSGPWNEEPYWKLRYKGACHDIFFLTTLSKVPEFIELMQSVVDRYAYPGDDIGCYIQPMVQGRGCHCEFNIFCDSSSVRETEEVRKLFVDASEVLMKNGAFFSRPYGLWADMVYSRYAEGVTALKKLKNVFDPHNILNPGKLCFQEITHGQSRRP